MHFRTTAKHSNSKNALDLTAFYPYLHTANSKADIGITEGRIICSTTTTLTVPVTLFAKVSAYINHITISCKLSKAMAEGKIRISNSNSVHSNFS